MRGGDKKKALAQIDMDDDMETENQLECNPCYQSNKGKNPHYAYAGPPPKMPGYQPGQDPSGGEKMLGHSGKAAGGKKEDKKEEKKGLAQLENDMDSETDCNPCYQSNKGKNPHYAYGGPPPKTPGYQPGLDPSGGEKMLPHSGKAAGGKRKMQRKVLLKWIQRLIAIHATNQT